MAAAQTVLWYHRDINSQSLPMSESQKATRATIPIGPIQVDGFMLPDGSYRMSQAQTAESVGKPSMNASRFLESRAIKTLLGEGYTDHTPESVEIEPEPGKRGQSRFNALPLEVVTAYWVNQCSQGNKQAIALVMALATETLERRFDAAFGVTRTEQERDDRLSQQVQQLTQQLDKLGEAYAMEDTIRQERDLFLQQLRELGADPWELPGDDSAPQ